MAKLISRAFKAPIQSSQKCPPSKKKLSAAIYARTRRCKQSKTVMIGKKLFFGLLWKNPFRLWLRRRVICVRHQMRKFAIAKLNKNWFECNLSARTQRIELKVPRSRQSRCECGQFNAKRSIESLLCFYFHFYDGFSWKTFPFFTGALPTLMCLTPSEVLREIISTESSRHVFHIKNLNLCWRR